MLLWDRHNEAVQVLSDYLLHSVELTELFHSVLSFRKALHKLFLYFWRMNCCLCLKEEWFALLIALLQNEIKDYFLVVSHPPPFPSSCIAMPCSFLGWIHTLLSSNSFVSLKYKNKNPNQPTNKKPLSSDHCNVWDLCHLLMKHKQQVMGNVTLQNTWAWRPKHLTVTNIAHKVICL